MSKNEKKREKEVLNENLEPFLKSEKTERKKTKVRKSRFFSFMTYATDKQIETTIAKHNNSVRAFAYIRHDKDDAEPHAHLIVRTYSSWSETQILKWFDWVKLKDNSNTMVEVLQDTQAMAEYLTHTDFASVQAGKHVYSRDDIKDFGLFDIVDKKDSYDETFQILTEVMAGTCERDLVRRYGKQYLFHRQQYLESADTVYAQQRLRRDEFKGEERERLLSLDTDVVDLASWLEGAE